MKAIEAQELSLELAGRRILERVSFEVEEGESVALVGPNGSGKTTILRCLLDLVPFSGHASVLGFDVSKEPIEARRRMAFVPQRTAFGAASVSEMLRFAADVRGVPIDRAKAVLAEVGLECLARVPARTLSGGMQQRLALALALLTDAPVMLLDEPTASLDRESQAAFVEIATRLRSSGRTLLFALHRAEEISRLADRVIELEAGRIRPRVARPPLAAVV
jgi:ABC-type multidrug transport system ATPase subunit